MNKLIIDKKIVITFAVSLAMVMSSLESTITATIMPYMSRDLGDISLYRWIGSSYLFANTISMPAFGRLADNYGRRRIYFIALLLFCIGSIGSGMAENSYSMILFRTIQGIGAGGLIVLATTVLGDLYTAFERAKIQGFLSALWNSAGALGPFIGAVIIHHLNWRYAFYINLPICALAWFLLKDNLSPDKSDEKRRFDVIGFLLLALSCCILLYSTENKITLIKIILFISSLSLYILYERSQDEQIIPFKIVKLPYVCNPCIASAFSRAASFGIITYLPLYFSISSTLKPLEVGIALTPMVIGSFLGNFIVGHIIQYFSLRNLAIITQIIYLLSNIALSLIVLLDISSIIVHLVLLMVGTSLGGSTLTGMIVIQNNIDSKNRAIASSLLTFSRSIGGAIGIGLLGALITNDLDFGSVNLINSIKNIFILIPIVSSIAILIVLKYPKNMYIEKKFKKSNIIEPNNLVLNRSKV